MVFKDEIKKANEILQKKFMKVDENKLEYIPYPELKKILHKANLVTTKEINIIIRSQQEEQFDYKKFEEVLFDVRFELAKSRIMDTNLDKLDDHLLYCFSQFDTEKTGKISMLNAQESLLKSKKTTLTPFQIQYLLGHSKPDKQGLIDYREFALECKEMICQVFSVKSLSDKATLIQTGSFKVPENLGDFSLDGLELLKVISSIDNIHRCSRNAT